LPPSDDKVDAEDKAEVGPDDEALLAPLAAFDPRLRARSKWACFLGGKASRKPSSNALLSAKLWNKICSPVINVVMARSGVRSESDLYSRKYCVKLRNCFEVSDALIRRTYLATQTTKTTPLNSVSAFRQNFSN
jgi:hypothetical protein